MLNNYEAIVKAVLDKTKFDSDMGELVKKQYTLSGIKLDSKGISAEIQKALSSASFDIHINPAVDTKEAQEIGRSYGKNLLSGITSGIGKGGIDLYGSLLGNNGAGKANANQIINGLVKMLESVNVQARSVKTELGDMTNAAKGLRNIKVSGVDETGALLTNVIKLNQETGEVSSNITTVTKKFDTNTKATREANEAYRELLNIQSRLNSLNANVLKLDVGKNSKEIAELNGQIETLTERYRKLRLYFNDDLSVEQLTNLDRAINMSADSLLLLQARIADTGNLNRITTEYKELYDTAKKISSLELKIAGLDSENDINQIRVLESQISDLEVTYGNLVESLNGRLPTEQWQKINDVFSETVRKLDLIEAQAKDADKQVSNLQVVTFDNKLTNWLEKNSKASKMFGGSIEELRKELYSLHAAGKLTDSGLKDLYGRLEDINQQAIAAGKTGKSFSSTFSNAFESIAKYISVATIMDATVDSLRDMYDAVYDVDTAMTELVKVTTATEQTYSKFIKTASSASKDIGTTVSEYINSTADFARLGHSLLESQELAKVANIYNVVGDDIESIDQATSSIISTMTAFGIATNNAMQIVDKFNKVSNEFPISSGGIGEALTKSASSMAAANNTLDQTIALITAANAVTQDPDAVGTAFKTLSMRIRGAKSALIEAGLDTDGMASSISTLRSEIEHLTGVDIMIDDSTFKSTYDILKEISEVWDTLEDVDQANVIELIAGKRQGNIVSSLMKNFDIAEDAMKASIESEGSAVAEHSKFMDSLAGKTQQFKSAWQELSITVLDSDFLKFLLDSGTAFLSVLTDIVETGALLPTILGGVAVAAFFKNLD